MIESTLRDWTCVLMLEAMVLAFVGYCNCYIPKHKMRKIAEFGQREDDGICLVEPELRINRIWYMILAIIASVGSAVYFVTHYFAEIVDTFHNQGLFFGVIETLLSLAIFLVMSAVFFIVPFVTEEKAVEALRKYCLEEHGVAIVIEQQ